MTKINRKIKRFLIKVSKIHQCYFNSTSITRKKRGVRKHGQPQKSNYLSRHTWSLAIDGKRSLIGLGIVRKIKSKIISIRHSAN